MFFWSYINDTLYENTDIRVSIVKNTCWLQKIEIGFEWLAGEDSLMNISFVLSFNMTKSCITVSTFIEVFLKYSDQLYQIPAL